MDNVDIIAIFDKYGAYALFGYLILERSFPIISRALDRIIPAQIKKRHMREEAQIKKRRALEEETLELEKQKVNAEERLLDLREREVLAMEDIAKHLILMTTKLEQINDRFDLSEQTMTQVSFSLATANQTLAILLDRNTRRRKSLGDTQPVKTIRRK